MKTAIKRLIRDQSGKALELVLIMLTLGGLVMAPTLGLMSTGLLAGRVYEEKTDELYAADAGVEDAIRWLLDGKTGNQAWVREGSCQNETARRVTPFYINDRRVDVRLERLPASNTYKIISTATGQQGSTTVMCTLFAVVWLKGDLKINYRFVGDLYLDGNATLENPRGQVVGNVVVLGDLDLQNSTNVTGNVSVEGDVTLEQSSRLNGNLCVGGNLTLRNGATINGNVFIEGGSIELANTAKITGNVYADRSITLSLDNPQAEIRGNICCTGNITIRLHNNANIFGYVRATGTVNVTKGDPNDICISTCNSCACNSNCPCVCQGISCIYANNSWPCTWPDPRPCPDVPVDPLDIYTWQILGVGM